MEKKTDFGMSLFFFSILFLPKVGSIDLKSIVLIGFMLASFSARDRNGIKARLDRNLIPLLVIIGILILQFLVNSVFNEDAYYNTLLRYIRCILSVIVIYNYIDCKRPTVDVFANSLCFALTIHAFAIVISILVPSIRPYINLFSGYSKKFLPLRSSGLVAGFDFAGYYLNAGLILRVLYNIRHKDKVFDFYTIAFIVGIIFTSRLNTLMLMGEILIIVLYMIKSKRISGSLSLLIIIPIIFVGSVFSILTIETFAPIKYSLESRYTWIATLDRSINLTYADSNLDVSLSRHFDIEDHVNRLFGNGIYAYKRDPGITKTIYEAGYFGVIIKLLFYLSIFFHCLKQRKKSIFHAFVFINIILVSALEFKLQFYFATGAFELLIAAYAMCLCIEKDSRVEDLYWQGEGAIVNKG